nr:putative ribonuclease H-like domain-containing protein [Tanacetum cinerariifolium]
LGHVNFKTINKLVKGNIVRGLPTKVFTNDNSCVACKKGKQHRASCKSKTVSSIDQPLFRIHIDLFGPTFVKSLSKKSYCLVITDDYSRFSWVFFLASKDETTPVLKTFIIGLENLLSLKVKIIRCDNGTEFKNFDLNQFCRLKGIKREFSVPRTPQQNGIAERKNRTLIEAARTLLANSLLPIPFWAEAVNTACYVQNRVLVTKPHNKTPYELLHGRLPSIGFMRPFGCPVTILNTLDPLGKFQGKVDEGFLVGYSVCSKAFRVFNSRNRIVQETLHDNFMENKPNVTGFGPAWLFDIDSLTRTINYHPVIAENQTNSHVGFQDTEKVEEEGTHTYVLFPVLSDGFTNSQNNNKDALVDGKEHDDDIQKSLYSDIHSLSSGAQTRKQGDKTENKDKGKSPLVTITGFRDLNAEFEECINNSSNGVNAASSSVSTAGHNFINSTNDFIVAGLSNAAASPIAENSLDMPNLEDLSHSNDAVDVGTEADINNLESIILVSPILTTRIHKDHPTSQIIGDLSSTTQTRIDLPYGKRAIGTKWVYRNKKDERGIVIRNKARLVAQGHTQEKGIDPKEVFAPVARIKAIRLFLAYASFMGFPVYQMYVKSAFLYGTIEEEVYVCQPPGFEDLENPDKVYKVVKALSGLHQAPRAWKVDEGFLVGYSVCNKAFRVFNSRTRIVQETLHVNFMENKPNVAGSGPAWLFDIDSLSQTMNYHPVITANQSNPNADALVDGKKHDDDIQKSVSPDIHSSSCGAQTRKQGDKTENKDKGKSPVVTITGFRDLNAKFEEYNNNSSNGVNAASSSVSTAGQNSISSTNDFSAAGPSNVAMPNLEDLSHDADDVGAEADINNLESIILVSPIPTTRIHKDHPTSQIISDMSSTNQTRSMARAVRDQDGISQMFNEDFHTCMFACFLLQEEPKRKVWILVDLPYGKRAIGTKWVYINKKDERGIVIRNKARLVAEGHTQEEGIDYEEIFAPVARIKAIRLFLAYASFMGFTVYQMDVKSAFLYGTIEEEVYICQPPGFEDLKNPDKVYKVVKALYGLHQAPRAWYETLANYLLENGFQRGTIDQTLFIKKQQKDILVVQIYVDDIIFGATNKALCKSFEKLMKDKFQMSS